MPTPRSYVCSVVVDRIEGDLAVLEVGDNQVDWPLEALPEGVAEGDSFNLTFSPLTNPANDLRQGLTPGPQGDEIEL